MTRLIRSNQNGALDNGQQGMTQGDVGPLAARTASFTALISSAKTFHLTVGDLGMAKISVPQRILDFNAGRDPERLALKLQALRTDAFVFLRGTCHLFWERLPGDEVLSRAPAAWACGDLHFQNFGSYKGDNRLVYFDINDFDEAALAPCTWDALRFLASVRVGAHSLRVNAAEATALCLRFLDAYAAALVDGKARWVERETAEGLIQDQLDALKKRNRKDFLDSRTELKGERRHIRLDGKKTLAVGDEQRAQVEDFMEAFAARQAEPNFFRLLDVARRIAGTGSLGVERYALLVEGKGSPDGNYVLELKQSLPSSLIDHLKVPQPDWLNEAERVVCLQRRMQAVSPAFLAPVTLGARACVLRDLQPSADRVDLAAWQGKLRRLETAIATMGQILAWAQLRSSGRQGSANADELITFMQERKWKTTLLNLATETAEAVEKDWEEYCASDLGTTAGREA